MTEKRRPGRPLIEAPPEVANFAGTPLPPESPDLMHLVHGAAAALVTDARAGATWAALRERHLETFRRLYVEGRVVSADVEFFGDEALTEFVGVSRVRGSLMFPDGRGELLATVVMAALEFLGARGERRCLACGAPLEHGGARYCSDAHRKLVKRRKKESFARPSKLFSTDGIG